MASVADALWFPHSETASCSTLWQRRHRFRYDELMGIGGGAGGHAAFKAKVIYPLGPLIRSITLYGAHEQTRTNPTGLQDLAWSPRCIADTVQ